MRTTKQVDLEIERIETELSSYTEQCKNRIALLKEERDEIVRQTGSRHFWSIQNYYHPYSLLGWLLFFAVTIGGFCWFIQCECDDASPLHIWLVGGAVFLLHLYLTLWGARQPLPRRQNRLILFGFLISLVVFIVWYVWLCYDESWFDAEGWHVRGARWDSFDVSYGWLAFIAFIYGFFLWIYCFFLYNWFRAPREGNEVPTADNSKGGLGIMGTIGGVMMMDRIFGSKKKKDHSLGSYWADHDDDGNYDPGAWRRKYDKR